jgi:hypothetical protein
MKNILYRLGVVIICFGIIYPIIIVGNSHNIDALSFGVHLGISVNGIIYGILLIGFGKVIELLESIKENTSKGNRVVSSIKESTFNTSEIAYSLSCSRCNKINKITEDDKVKGTYTCSNCYTVNSIKQ